ncbi:hypothetical protein FZ103_09455 [Streptomonospora sp. PA3]|nr:hypothetical protein [Streptomonospora sp. PA3]
MLVDKLTEPVTWFVLVGVVAQTAVLIKPEIVWRQRGRNRLDALPPRLATVFLWMSRCGAAMTIVVLIVFLFL